MKMLHGWVWLCRIPFFKVFSFFSTIQALRANNIKLNDQVYCIDYYA